MLTPGYGLTATERVLPRVTLDFLTPSLDSRITFTRTGNTATRVNSSGFVEVINANLPRFDYDPVTLSNLGLLIEDTRTNLALQSQTLTPSWTSDGASQMVTNVAVSPTGNQDASQLRYVSATYRYLFTSVTAGVVYTYSIYAKIGTGGNNTATLSSTEFGTTFNLTGNGSVVSGTGNIVPVGNGWYRLWRTFTAAGASTAIGFSTAGTFTSGQGYYFWGAQLEAGAFPTSLIPTTTTSVQRNPDVAVVTGTNFSSWWQATTGGLVVRAQQKGVSGTAPWVQFDDTTTDNIIALRGNTTNPELYIKATTDQAQIDAGTLAANTNYGFGGAWNTNSCAAAINGGAAVTDPSATIPTVTQARLGSDGTNYLNGWLQNIRYWPQRLTDNEVQAFSKL